MKAVDPRPLAATAEVAHDGVLLLVGIGGRLVVVCAAAAMDSGLRHVALSRVEEACAQMEALAPRVVVVPAAMDREERARIGTAAVAVGAEIVDLPAVSDLAVVSHIVARALAAQSAKIARHAEAAR